MSFGTVIFRYLGSNLTGKIEIVKELFSPALEMQLFSILLKCQEIDMQMQTFTDEN